MSLWVVNDTVLPPIFTQRSATRGRKIVLGTLSPSQRESIVDWWSDPADDVRLQDLPELLTQEMRNGEFNGDPKSSRYDPLIIVAIMDSYYGVPNERIAEEMLSYGI